MQDNVFQTYFKDIDTRAKLRILIVSNDHFFFASVPYNVTTRSF